jgi:hemerythrin-like domain-containing protein
MSFTIDPVTLPDSFDTVVVDLYRDIHKAIRTELFAVTTRAGSVDPGDRAAKADFARHVADLADLLEQHAGHEDAAVQPALEVHLPRLAARVAVEHQTFEARVPQLVDRAAELCDLAEPAARRQVQGFYVDLAAFTSGYLAHQDLEEREIMPALHDVLGTEATLAIHLQVVGSIPPDAMARSLALMLPAMNVDDRTELLGGMQATAPPEVFGEVWGLACSVLYPQDIEPVAARLGL